MAQADWEHEFAEYFAARGQALRRTAYALCGDWFVAEDLVQTTFVRLYRHWRRVRLDTVDAYTRRILVNLFLSRWRSHRKERIVAEVPDRGTTVPAAEDRIDLHRALAELPPRQRAVVVLRYLDDLPVAEVARVLGMAEGTVKSQTARGVQSLRSALGEPVGHVQDSTRE